MSGYLLERVRWAAAAYADYDRPTVAAIVAAASAAACTASERLAAAAVAETRMGVAADKAERNRACALAKQDDFVSPRIDASRKVVALPRPAGVVVAHVPATDPVAAVYSTVLSALMTRNAAVVVPDPRAASCITEAAELLAGAAVNAGAPDGIVQVTEEPLTADVEVTHSPGNVPVLVDATADISAAARRIADSKAFDNSLLPTSESVLIAEGAIADALRTAIGDCGGRLLDEDEVRRLRGYLFPDGHLKAEAVGRDAAWIADQAGLRVAPKTRVLVAPLDLVISEEPLAHATPAPVLGMVTAADADRGIRAARAVVRIGGPAHAAVVHSENPGVVADFAAHLPVRQVAVNAGGNSLDAELSPHQLLTWTRIAYAADAPMPSFADVSPWRSPTGPVPAYPRASNDPETSR